MIEGYGEQPRRFYLKQLVNSRIGEKVPIGAHVTTLWHEESGNKRAQILSVEIKHSSEKAVFVRCKEENLQSVLNFIKTLEGN